MHGIIDLMETVDVSTNRMKNPYLQEYLLRNNQDLLLKFDCFIFGKDIFFLNT